MARGKYPIAIKQAMVTRFLKDPESKINEFSKENGVPETCLRDWIREAQAGILGDMNKPKHHKYWKLEEKFKAIIEYEKLTEQEKGKWLRRHALKHEYLKVWEKELKEELSILNKKPTNGERKEIQALKKELRRKDKALAEASALLLLKKKADIIFGENGEDK